MGIRTIVEKVEIAAVAMLATVETAMAEAKPVSIEGNAWVAVLLIVGFVAVIYFVIIGSLGVEKRDARLGRRDDHEHGWFGFSEKPRNDRDDSSGSSDN